MQGIELIPRVLSCSANESHEREEALSFNTIVSLKLDFVAQKKGGMAVSAVWTLVYLLAPCPAEPRSTPTHTGETPCAPLLKSKSMLLLV